MIFKYFLSILPTLFSNIFLAFIFFIIGIVSGFLLLDKDEHDHLTAMLKEDEVKKVMEFDYQFTKEKLEMIYGQKIEECPTGLELISFYSTPYNSLEAYLDDNQNIKICSFKIPKAIANKGHY